MVLFDYAFYAEKYGGNLIAEKDWRKNLVKANTYLSKAMHQSPDETNLELVQFCLCEAAEIIYQDDKNRAACGGKEVQSESNDGYSVSYAAEESLKSKIYGTITRYLGSSGLLYAGVKCNADKCGHHDL